MIIVRNTFIAKPGMASKLAAQFKEMASAVPGMKARVMTDLTGDFNTVVFEHDEPSIGEFEARMKQYQTDPAMRDKMKGYTDLYKTGSRQIFQVL